MKLNKKQELELTECVENFVKFVEKRKDDKSYNYAGAFGLGIMMGMSGAKQNICACCKKWDENKGCTVKKCFFDEVYIDITLEIVKRKTSLLLATTLNEN